MQVGLLPNSCTLFAAWFYQIPLMNHLDNRLLKCFKGIAIFLRVAMCNCLRVAMSRYFEWLSAVSREWLCLCLCCRVAMCGYLQVAMCSQRIPTYYLACFAPSSCPYSKLALRKIGFRVSAWCQTRMNS